MTLDKRIDAVRLAILDGRMDDATALSQAIEADAATLPAPDPRALRRAMRLLQATVSGLRAATVRIAQARGLGLSSDVYDARGQRHSHASTQPPARRW
jgi:hypothetical protein